jgi:hypothetical protein
VLTNASVKPITIASQCIVETGVPIPIFRFLNRICVRLHRNPPRADEENTMGIPVKWRVVLVATMRITPAEVRRQENISRRKRKAKRSTKNSDEDLHIAGSWG